MSDMPFESVIKGKVSETLVQNLLQNAGYTIKRLGIEEQIPEIISLDQDAYQQLNLPEWFRLLPDFLAVKLNSEHNHAVMIEVKFRYKLEKSDIKSLHSRLEQQYQYWSDTKTVLLCAGLNSSGRCHQDYFRVIDHAQLDKIKLALEDETMTSRDIWECLPQLHQVFTGFDLHGESCSNADYLAETIQFLGDMKNSKPMDKLK